MKPHEWPFLAFHWCELARIFFLVQRDFSSDDYSNLRVSSDVVPFGSELQVRLRCW